MRSPRTHSCFSDIHTAWAIDEPPTPDPDYLDTPTYDRRNADNASYNTDSGPPSRWWTFVLPRAGDSSSTAGATTNSQSLTRPEGVRNRSMTWLTSRTVLREAVAFARKDKQDDERGGLNSRATVHSLDAGNLGHHTTSSLQPGPSAIPPRENLHAPEDYGYESDFRNLDDGLNEWPVRRKRIRNFILVDPYVPLVCPSPAPLSGTHTSNLHSCSDLSIYLQLAQHLVLLRIYALQK